MVFLVARATVYHARMNHNTAHSTVHTPGKEYAQYSPIYVPRPGRYNPILSPLLSCPDLSLQWIQIIEAMRKRALQCRFQMDPRTSCVITK